MTIEALQKLYHAQPFTPFEIHLTDGRRFSVEHREVIALGPRGRTVFVYHEDESFDIVDLLLVTGLHAKVRSKRNGGTRK